MTFSSPGIALLLTSLMAIVHFLGEELEEYIGSQKEELISFSSGVSIAYIFVQLMPEFHRVASEATEMIFVFPLLGFSSIHLLEKYIAKSDLEQEAVKEDYAEIHSGFLFLYYGAIGYLIASLLAENAVTGLLFFLPIILHSAISSLSLTELHEEFAQKLWVKIAISIAPIIGVLTHNIGNFTRNQFNPVFGLVIGMFFYVVIRDSIPKNDRGQPVEYIAGTLLYLIVILIANMI